MFCLSFMFIVFLIVGCVLFDLYYDCLVVLVLVILFGVYGELMVVVGDWQKVVNDVWLKKVVSIVFNSNCDV